MYRVEPFPTQVTYPLTEYSHWKKDSSSPREYQTVSGTFSSTVSRVFFIVNNRLSVSCRVVFDPSSLAQHNVTVDWIRRPATPYRRSVSTDGDTRPPSSRAMADCVVPIRSASASLRSLSSLRADHFQGHLIFPQFPLLRPCKNFGVTLTILSFTSYQR